MSFHGVQMERPRANERAMEKTVFQMTYHRNVSRKNCVCQSSLCEPRTSARSMTNIIASAKAGWFMHRPTPSRLSEQFWTWKGQPEPHGKRRAFMPTMTLIGFSNESVRKKYDSVNCDVSMSPASADAPCRRR